MDVRFILFRICEKNKFLTKKGIPDSGFKKNLHSILTHNEEMYSAKILLGPKNPAIVHSLEG
jgi:hypothetical protein